MLAFPPLVGALGKLFVRDIGTTPDLPIRGDGLVQQSLAELYSPCGWSSAGADEFVHELLSLGAWLGYLVRGRAALMPSFVAELLRCELGVAPSPSSRAGNASEIRTLLRFYADLAVGSRRLLRQARGAGKSGRAKLVRPRGQGISQPYVWNERAAKEIDARLQHIMRN